MLLDFNSIAQVYETNPSYNSSNNWVIGDSIGLEFKHDSILFTLSRKNNIDEGTSVLSDKNGNLLYYSNGYSLFNSVDFEVISELLGSSSSTQGSLILNNGDSTFNVFVTDFCNYPSPKLSLTSFNLSGSIINIDRLNRLLLTDGTEKISGIMMKNSITPLSITHNKGDYFYSFFMNKSNDIICPTISKISSSAMLRNSYGQGMIKLSPSGKFVAMAATYFSGFFEIYPFDSETGIVGESVVSLQNIRPYGIEFSPNEKFLYVTLVSGDLLQVNIETETYINIGFTKNDAFTGMQRGPDNKIYIARVLEPFLDVIEFPDSAGMACGFVQKAVTLPANVNYGLPNFNASYFYTPSIDFAYTEDCCEHSYAFEGRDTLQATSWKWLFKDVRNETIEVRQGKNVTYTFPQADSLENKYEVSHIAITATRSDTVTKTLTIRPKWKKDELGKDTFYCQGKQANISLIAPPNMHCVHWNGEEPNLDDNLGPIVDYDHFHTDTLRVDTAGTYIVKLTNKTFCQAWDTITISEIPNPNKPNIQRKGQEIESNTVAAKYTWYLDGKLKFQTQNQTQIPNSNGFWQVQLVSEYGCESELSDSFYVGFASIRDVRLEMLDFRLYPNPSDGKVTIEVPKKGVYKIVVTDLQGKVIYSEKQLLSLSFELEFEFAKGNYIITLIDENGQVGSKQMEVVN